MKNLQTLVDQHDNIVNYFYNDTIAQFHRSRTDLFSRMNLIEKEYTNWRDEQRAAREACILTNQSHHMPGLFVKGPDAMRLLQYLTPVSLAKVVVGGAKQYFACTPRGHHVGDCVLHYFGDEEGFELTSGMPVLNWIRYHGETGGYDVEMRFDPTTPFNPTGRRTKFRFELEGPNARSVLEEVTEGEIPELKFFKTANIRIAGVDVMILRHGMGQLGGGELSGPYEHLEHVRDALMKAGEKYGLRLGGTMTYFSACASGWVPYPLPGIYTGEELRAYREWLPIDSWEANQQFAGSFYSENVEDYYWTPSGLGYDRFVKFDHEFIGRQALEAALEKPRRVRRILEWNSDDVVKVSRSQFVPGPIYKSIELPTPIYGWPQSDEVRALDGKLIGRSQYGGYNVCDRTVISIGCIDEAHAQVGSEVVLTWGELDGGSRKPHVERHEQTTIRAKLFAAPYGHAAELREAKL